MTLEDTARWGLTKIVAAMICDGIPVDVVMADVREGCELAARLLARRAAVTQ